MKRIALLFAVFIINGCTGIEQKKDSTDATAAEPTEIEETTQEVVAEVPAVTREEFDALVADVEKLAALHNAIPLNGEDKGTTRTPAIIISDSLSIILPTSYDSEDFSKLKPTLESKTWVGLFKNDNNSVTCSQTKLKIEAIHDNDYGGEIKISCEGYDKDPMLLLAGIEISADLQIDSYKGLKSSLNLGESMQLGGLTIKKSGTRNKEHDYIIDDYKLVITGEKNGTNIEQTLFWISTEGRCDFIWAGDIDKDGFPDLYMDIAYKTSFMNPALFLSSKAGDNELLKLVAETRVFSANE